MIVIPAVNLRDGACVHPAGGARDGESVQLADAIEVARSWAAIGFGRLHVTDLDAASRRGDNAAVILSLLHSIDVEIQVRGDVRTIDEVDRLLQAGADRVVVGARAIEEASWLGDVAFQFPGRVAVAVLVRDRRVTTRDRSTMPRDVLSMIDDWNELPLAAVIVTVAQRDRHMRGTDLFLMEDLTELSVHPVIAAGGIATLPELRDLEERGVSGAIVGGALTSGGLDARVLADQFSQQ
ncbi:MAG TPA: HisA/HisF-related TIM barrel protein [Gemmatimonadaceae bacterium]|nr:HisA/HisF-related TIM barrel protein [Gemmatimonadaceae bacterium]